MGGQDQKPDAVAVVRDAMVRRMSGGPFFRDQLSAVEPELRVLQQRELRVKTLGGVYARVEMSSYVRDMLEELVTRQTVQSV